MEKNNESMAKRGLEGGVRILANALLIIVLIFVFAEVITRYVFSNSYSFLEEFSKWSQIWIAYLMLGVVEKTRDHIKVDILYRKMDMKYQTPLLIVHDLIALAFCIVLFLSGAQAAQNWYFLGYQSTTEFIVPLWTVMLSAPLGAVILGFFVIEHIVTDIRSLMHR